MNPPFVADFLFWGQIEQLREGTGHLVQESVVFFLHAFISLLRFCPFTSERELVNISDCTQLVCLLMKFNVLVVVKTNYILVCTHLGNHVSVFFCLK